MFVDERMNWAEDLQHLFWVEEILSFAVSNTSHGECEAAQLISRLQHPTFPQELRTSFSADR